MPRACLVCDNVPLPLRICVPASEAMFGPFATLSPGGETGARQPVLRLFRDQDRGLRPPSVVATDAPMRDRAHVEAGTSVGRFRAVLASPRPDRAARRTTEPSTFTRVEERSTGRRHRR